MGPAHWQVLNKLREDRKFSAHKIEVNKGPLWGTYLNFMSTLKKRENLEYDRR